MDSKNLLIVGAVGVGGYLAYQWYYGAGGYADQQACAADPTSADINFPGRLAYGVWSTAAAANQTALAYIASLPAATTAAQLALYACARVAVTKYPSLALAQAAATAETTAQGGTVGAAVAVPGGTGISMSAISGPVGSPTLAQQQAAANAAASNAAASNSSAPTTPAPSSLDTMYATLKNQAASDSFFTGSGDARTGSVDHWNYYLAQLVPAGVTIPGGLFSNVAGDDPNNLTAAQYWAVMAPWLASNAGLSGLGMYGGLGAIVRAYRGR